MASGTEVWCDKDSVRGKNCKRLGMQRSLQLLCRPTDGRPGTLSAHSSSCMPTRYLVAHLQLASIGANCCARGRPAAQLWVAVVAAAVQEQAAWPGARDAARQARSSTQRNHRAPLTQHEQRRKAKGSHDAYIACVFQTEPVCAQGSGPDSRRPPTLLGVGRPVPT